MASFGERLRSEREKKKITLEQVATATKVGVRMLRALEEEKFDQLPGGIFNKGFVRAYARYLGLDEQQAVADYLAAAGPPPAPAPEVEELRAIAERRAKEKERTRRIDTGELPWGRAAMVLLVVALGLAVWGFYSREQGHMIRSKAAGSARRPATSQTNVSASPAALDSRGEPGAIAATPAVQSITAATPAEPVASTNPAPAGLAGAFMVRIEAQEDSWLSITADGKLVFADTLIGSAEKTIQAQHEVSIRAGNTGALEFSFNGNKLPSQGDYGEVKTLIFRPTGLEPQTAKPPG